MEVKAKCDLFRRLQSLFLTEASPFSGRREVYWGRVRAASLSLVAIIILLLLLLPAERGEPEAFIEQNEYEVRRAEGASSAASSYSGPPSSAGSPLNSMRTRSAPTISRKTSRDSSMILSRGGADSRNEVPAGILVSVKLRSKLVATSISLPIIGEVTEDILHEGSLAVPAGAKIFGTVSFDGGTRALVAWNSIQLADGRKRKFSALGIGRDMQAGIEGEIGSDAGKNVVGQALSRLIGAYAEGSMERGMFGGSSGGNSNGWKNAVAEVAKTQADGLAQDLQKERRWIEIDASEPQYAILTEPFVFRDPGGGFE